MSDQAMTVGSFLSFGFENAKRHFLKFFGLLILQVAVIIAGSVISVALSSVIGDAGSAIGSVLTFFLMITVNFGFLKNVLNLCRGEKIDVMAFVKAKPATIVSFAIASLLCGAIAGIGYLLLVIPGIIATLMLFLAPFLVTDKDMGPIEAIKESIKLTSGHKIDMFLGILVSMFIVSFASMFVITLIFTIPMGLFIYVYPYLHLTGQLDEAKKRLEASGQ